MRFLTILLSIVFVSCFSLLKAQEITGIAAKKVHPFANSITKNKKGEIRIIKFDKNKISSAKSSTNLMNEFVDLPKNSSLEKIKTQKDELGYIQTHYQLIYSGYKVENKILKINTLNGYVVSAVLEIPNFSTTKFKANTINKTETSTDFSSIKAALNLTSSATFKIENDSKPIWIEKNNELILCFKVTVKQEKPLLKKMVYTNSSSGQIEKIVENIIHTDEVGKATTKYNGVKSITTNKVSANSYTLSETGRGGGISTLNFQNGSTSGVEFTNTSNNWVSSTDDVAYDVHYGAEMTFDFYKSKFNRNSFDDGGAKITSNTHYGNGYNNAFWNGESFTYGDGDGISYSAFTSLDVVGHEMTHAVTQYSANLIYENESGALNESFSDIFGVTIDFWKNPTTANWRQGDQFSTSGLGFRNMANPSEFNDPDTYLGNGWVTDPMYDNGGVHTNSGVQNYWYYLLCQGGSGTNDNGTNYSISGIGRDDAIKIVYRSLTFYLTANSSYEDARSSSIQAAVDLFGECSQQVIQTTNAWNAVGVGDIYTNAVIANFSASKTIGCSVPFTTNFSNLSTNASTYSWNFGDGTAISTTANPSHTYTSAGNYSVTLSVTGTSGCNGSDSEAKSNFINVSNLGSPKTATCNPVSNYPASGYGIKQVRFHSINQLSGNATEGNKDFTCEGRTELIVGGVDSLLIETVSNEYVTAWIDFNDDGDFVDIGEKIYSATNFDNYTTIHSSLITFPTTVVKNKPLRMRVMSDFESISTACSQLVYGQFEDYTVIFKDATAAPIAHFTSDKNAINSGESISYYHYSENAPTSFSWTFPGGTPSSSTEANPVVTYQNAGSYNVTLKASNSFGNDIIEKVEYVTVKNSFNLCSEIKSSTATAGNLYDSGGPDGYYDVYQNCSFLISPKCASEVQLTFSSINLESYTQITIYDGENSSAPLLYQSYYYGTSTIPSTLIAKSGKMFITWSSYYYSGIGFEASWTSTIPSSAPPVANFSVNDVTPALNTPINFTNKTSKDATSWLWNFGDGLTSTIQHPSISYTKSGQKSVKLIAYTCQNSDTIVKQITVESAPTLQTNKNSFSTNLTCIDSLSQQLIIKNKSGGTLNYTIDSPNVDWLTVEGKLINSLLAGDSSILNVRFRSVGLSANTYSTNIVIDHNQEFDGSTIIPCSMVVSGNPKIELSQTCLNYGNVYQNVPKSDSVLITNKGCSNLTVSVSSTNTVFQPSITSTTILPYSTKWVSVTLNSKTIGTLSDTLLISTNDRDTSICLTGTIVATPIISISPTTVKAIETVCNDSITLPIQIINSGGADLTITLPTTNNVLVYTYGVSTTDSEYNNLISGINQFYSNYSLTTTNTTNASQLQTDLINKSVFLIPTIQYNTVTHWSSFKTVLSNFVSNGGTIIMTGNPSDYDYATPSGLLSVSKFGSPTNGTLAISNPKHLLFENVDSYFYVDIHTYTKKITNTDFISLAKLGTNDAIGYRLVGLGKIIYLGPSFYYNVTNDNRLVSNALKWAINRDENVLKQVNLSATSQYIAPYDTLKTEITFNSNGLINGSYSGYYNVATNDPIYPIFKIPYILKVNANPIIALSKSCLDFDTVFQNVSKSDSLLVSNTGCSDLTAMVSTTSSEFTTKNTFYTIAPGNSRWIAIQLNSSTTGILSNILSIKNNYRDTSICLKATILPSPIIKINPNTITKTITVCNDSISVPVQIINSGGSNLTFKKSDIQNKNVLAYNYNYGNRYSNLISGINNYFTNYTLSTTKTTDAIQLSKDLIGKSVFIIPANEGYWSSNQWFNFKPVLQDFVSNGGSIIVAGSYSSYDISDDAGLFTVSEYNNYVSNGTTISTTLSSHPFFENVDFPLITPGDYRYTYSTIPKKITNTDYTSIAKINDYEALGYRSVGDGKIIFLAFDYYYTNSNTQKIAANALKWAINTSQISNLSIYPTQGTVHPNDTLTANVSFPSKGYLDGTYSGKYKLETNDPLHPTFDIPYTFTIKANPIIGLSKSCLNFGNVLQGIAKKDSISISNSGCSNLIVQLTSNNSSFVSSRSNDTVNPGKSKWFVVTLNSVVKGKISSTLTIKNNHRDTSICLNAEIIPSPVIAISPNPVIGNVTVCNENLTIPIQIINKGDTTLTFNSDIDQKNKNVLAYNNSNYYSYKYTNLMSGINNYFTNYTLTTTSTLSAVQLANDLKGKSVFIIPSNEGNWSSSLWLGFKTVLQDFVNQGGVIIVAGNNSNYDIVESAGLFSLKDYIINLSYGSNITLTESGHPLFSNISQPFVSPGDYWSHTTTFPKKFNNSDYTSLAKYTDYEVVGYRSVGAGKIIFLAFDYYYTNSNINRLAANALKWGIENSISSKLKLTPSSGTVAKNDTLTVQLSFDSKDFLNGSYSGDFKLSTNDPIQPTFSIPCLINIVANPVMQVDKSCLDFGKVSKGVEKQDSIQITNTGCSDMIVYPTIIGDGFNLSPTIGNSITIKPNSTESISVFVSSFVKGEITGKLVLKNNAKDSTICLKARIIATPEISHSPNPILIDITDCNESVTVPIQLINRGDTTLTFNEVFAQDNKNVLVYSYFAGQRYSNQMNGINTYFTDFTLSTSTTTDALQLETDLKNKSVFLIPSNEGNWDSLTWVSFKPVLQKFISDGGTILISGNRLMYDISDDAGLFTNNGYFDTQDIQSTIVPSSEDHQIFENIDFPFITSGIYWQTLFPRKITNPDYISLAKVEDYDAIGYRTIDKGKIIFLGFNYITTDSRVDRITANTLKWAINSSIQSNFKLTPTSGKVSKNDSLEVNLTFDPSGLENGNYSGNYILTSNDPLNKTYSMPYEIKIQGKPRIETDKNCIDFGDIPQNGVKKDSIMISNSGCADLLISSIDFSNSNFTSPLTEITILPGENMWIPVTATINSLDSIKGTMQLKSNDKEVTVCLKGLGISTPIIQVDPNPIYRTINYCYDTNTVFTFDIVNNGDKDLIIESIIPYENPNMIYRISIDSKVIPPNGKQQVKVYINTNFYTYNGSLKITSNDPLAENFIVPYSISFKQICIPDRAYIGENGIGIWNVKLNNTTFETLYNANILYGDNFCNTSTVLYAGNEYDFSVTTGLYVNEYVKAWIDFNDDGLLADTEVVFTSDNILTDHIGKISIPKENISTRVPLRLRIISDNTPFSSSCPFLQYGQSIDYSVLILDTNSHAGLKEIQKASILIVPNPANNLFYVKGLDSGEEYKLSVFDMQGKLVVNQEIINNNPISTSEIESGAYFVKIYEKGKEINQQKLIIVR